MALKKSKFINRRARKVPSR